VKFFLKERISACPPKHEPAAGIRGANTPGGTVRLSFTRATGAPGKLTINFLFCADRGETPAGLFVFESNIEIRTTGTGENREGKDHNELLTESKRLDLCASQVPIRKSEYVIAPFLWVAIQGG
jgi:hypothetical protein